MMKNMMMRSNMWLEKENAEAYEKFAQTHSLYRQTGKQLIELATFAPGMTVVDLACGTGVVTELLVEMVPQLESIIAVDWSKAMLDVAIRKPTLAGVQIHQASAEVLDTVLPAESVDVILCNSAFWQMPTSETLAALHKVLKRHGQLIVNGPARRFELEGKPSELEETFKKEILAVAQADYGYVPSQKIFPPFNKTMRQMSMEQIKTMFESAGFELARYHMLDIEQTAADHYAFLQIPIMGPRYLRNVDYPTTVEIIDKAYQRLDHAMVDVTPWGYHVLVKQ